MSDIVKILWNNDSWCLDEKQQDRNYDEDRKMGACFSKVIKRKYSQKLLFILAYIREKIFYSKVYKL
jgi:hypothetical protein